MLKAYYSIYPIYTYLTNICDSVVSSWASRGLWILGKQAVYLAFKISRQS